jgi:glycosyltransferase involved in cell wall biosynthesis
MSSARIPLSAAIITKNEEQALPSCLRSLAFLDDIVVVDCGSSDRTVALAGEFGCRVFVEDWKGYGPQKNSAVAKCENDWVLLVDADERVPPEAQQAIRETVHRPSAAAYRLRMKHHLGGRWIRHGGAWPDWHIRLVDRTQGSFQGQIHEQWVTGGRIGDVDAHLEHYAFSGYSDMLKSLDEYSTLHAQALFTAGRRARPWTPVTHGIAMFLKVYFLQRCCFLGLDGLVSALTRAGGSFFKYAKLLELERAARGDRSGGTGNSV